MNNTTRPSDFPGEALRKEMDKKIAYISSFEDTLPGFIIVHNLIDYSVAYISQNGLKFLGFSLAQIQSLGREYHKKFLSPESALFVDDLLTFLVKSDGDTSVSFFQQVFNSQNNQWEWHISNSKVLLRDEHHVPVLSITVAISMDGKPFFESNVQRIYEENIFLKNNQGLFATLTSREKEILTQMALSKSSEEIAEQLFISPTTVNTHRRNIRRKINADKPYDIIRFAQSFNLI